METSKKWTGPTLLDLMSYVEDIPASRSARRAKGKAKKTRATSGHGYEKPYAFFDPVMRSLKMYEATCPLGDLPSLEKLPPSGMTVSGVLFLQPPWEQITAATDSLSWPTPKAWDWKNNGSPAEMNRKSPNLPAMVKMWPTPTAVTRPMEGNVRLYRAKIEAGEMTEEEATAILGKSPYEAQGKLPAMWPTPTTQEVEHPNAEWYLEKTRLRRRSKTGPRGHSMGLADAVQMWPTPRAAMAETRNHTVYLRSTDKPQNLENKVASSDPSLVGGRLNPTWVEWLMGFPLGWTDLEDSETP